MARKKNATITKLRSAGVSAPYASQIASGNRRPSLEKALEIHSKTGLRFGPLVGMARVAIEALQKSARRASA